MPSGTFRPGIGNVRTFIDRSAQDYWNKVKRRGISIEEANSFYKRLKEGGAKKVGKTVLEMVAGKVTSDEHRIGVQVPSISVTSTRARFAGGGNPDAKKHTTRLHLGRPSSKSIKALERLAGSEEVTFKDTIRDNNYGAGNPRRGEMEVFTGFNQKAFAMWDDAHVSADGVLTRYYPSGDLLPQADAEQRIYGLAKYFKQHYRIMSNASFFSTDVKVHVYSPNSPGYTAANVFAGAFTTSLATPQREGAIPEYYQLQDLQQGLDRRFVLCDPKATMEMSPRFTSRFVKVKTYKQRLRPGDVWDFTVWDHLGSGIRLDQAEAQRRSNTASLMSYIIVLELNGALCQAFENTSSGVGDSFIGTAPTSVSIEHSSSMCAVRAIDDSLETRNSDPGSGGVQRGRFAVKSFITKESGGAIVNRSVSQIAQKGGPVGTFFIPVMTDTEINYSLPASEQ